MRLPCKKDLELQAMGRTSYSGLWEAPSDVQALAHLYGSMDSDAHPGTERLTSVVPPSPSSPQPPNSE